MPDTFSFDVLGISPNKLRANLNRISTRDPAFKRAREVHRISKIPSLRDKAESFVKVAKRYPDVSYPRRFLFALSLYRKADIVENEREQLTGCKTQTLGYDYKSFVGYCRGYYYPNMTIDQRRGTAHAVMGKRSWKTVYIHPGYTLFSNMDDMGIDLWKLHKKVKDNKDKFIAEFKNQTGASDTHARQMLSNISFARWFSSKVNDIYRKRDGKKKAKKWVKKTFAKTGITPEGKELLYALAFKNAKWNAKKRKAKLKKVLKVIKTVGEIALKAAKVIPGVGDAIEAVEKAVKKVPGVKEAVELADKVKGTIKEAKKLGDVVKLDKIKDLGNNPEVRKALAMDKLVKGTISSVVKSVKAPDIKSIIKAAELVAPDKVKTAMNLVKEAQELNPEAIAKIKSIQSLADAGLYEAQKALGTLRIAMKVQNTARSQALAKHRQWQYW